MAVDVRFLGHSAFHISGAGADVLAPLRKYTFSVGNRGVAYESEAVTGMLQVAMGIKLW